MGLKNTREAKIYASVLADGLIHVEVPEGTDGAVKREYETSDGKVGSKFEHVYDELTGTISSLAFFDGNFGKQLQVTVADDAGGKPIMLSLSTASSYGEDLMKKLPSVNLTKEVTLKPYSFDDDKGRKRKGFSVLQGGTKVANFYYDVEKKKNLHGYPVPPVPKKGKQLTTDEWKMYFMQARMFLVDETEKIFANILTTTDVEKVADPEIEFQEF